MCYAQPCAGHAAQVVLLAQACDGCQPGSGSQHLNACATARVQTLPLPCLPCPVHRGSADLDSFCAFLSAQPLNVGTQLNFMRHAGAWLLATPWIGDHTLQVGREPTPCCCSDPIRPATCCRRCACRWLAGCVCAGGRRQHALQPGMHCRRLGLACCGRIAGGGAHQPDQCNSFLLTRMSHLLCPH